MIKAIVTNIKDLRRPCLTVDKECVDEIIQDLKDTLKTKEGYGLTANQIGYNKAVSVIRIPQRYNKETKQVEFMEKVLINMKILEKTRPIKIQDESCLSFKGISVITKRYVFCTIEYLDENLKPKTEMFQDIPAFVVQHECDHQHGVTLFERKYQDKNHRK